MLAGAMETINVTPIQMLVFSALIVAVDPVAVSNVQEEFYKKGIFTISINSEQYIQTILVQNWK